MVPVSSSNVAQVGHDPETGTLQVEFHNGATYQYRDVPDHVAAELVSAASVGGYLARNIKGHYAARRI